MKTKETFNKDSQAPDSDVEISSDVAPSVKDSIDTSAPLVPRPPPEESKPEEDVIVIAFTDMCWCATGLGLGSTVFSCLHK